MKLSYKNIEREKKQRERHDWRRNRGFNPSFTSSYISAANIGQVFMSAEEIRLFVASLDISEALLKLAHWNVALGSKNNSAPKTKNYLLSRLFAYNDSIRIQRLIATSTQTKEWISPYQTRLLISLLIHNSSLCSNKTLDDSYALSELGKVILSITDAFEKNINLPGGDTSRLLFAEQGVRNNGYQADSRLFEDISIKGYLVNKILNLEGVEAAITDHLGFSPLELQTALIAIWVFFFAHNGEDAPRAAFHTINFEYLLGSSGISKPVGDYILKRLCVDIKDSPVSLEDGKSFDIAFLADHPLAIYEGVIQCLDIEFLQARVARELWNLARFVAKKDKIHRITADAGYFFEDFCEEQLRIIESTRKQNMAVLYSSNDLGKAALDFLYVEGDVAIAIECKSTVLPTNALYSDDPSLLAEAIKDKFVTGKPGNKQGFKQISDHLETVLKRPSDFGLENVKTIIPCLLVADSTLTSAFCYDFVIHESKKIFENFGTIIAQPVLIYTEDLSLIVERCKILSPMDILLDLTPGNVQLSMSTKNHILSKWNLPENLRISPIKHLHFFDMALSKLKAVSIVGPIRICNNCNNQLSTVNTEDAMKIWWCRKCQREYGALTQQELRALDEHIAEVIAIYRQER